MSERDDAFSVRDMLDHAREATGLLGGIDRQGLRRNRVLQLALTRLVEIVGEAANRVSAGARKEYPSVPWPHIIGMRNRLVHGYDVVDYDLLWDTITTDLPSPVSRLPSLRVLDG